MTDAQTEARAIVSAALPPHEQAMLGGDAVVVLSDLIATALAAKDAELAGAMDASERFSVAWRDAERRSARAEAQIAGTLKALKEIDALDEAMGHDLRERHAFEAVAIARRALEAWGDENG